MGLSTPLGRRPQGWFIPYRYADTVAAEPDGYPEIWSRRGYNEQSAVAPLLAGAAAKQLFARHYAATRMTTAVDGTGASRLPPIDGAIETSLWIEKS